MPVAPIDRWIETPTASIEVTAPQEVALYTKMFDHLRKPALYGAAARQRIIRAIEDLAGDEPVSGTTGR